MLSRRDVHRLLGAAAMIGLSRPALAQTKVPEGVDSHAHIFRRGLPLADARRYAPDYDATPEDYIRVLDSHGIAHGVLVQPSFLGTDNSYIEAALTRYPSRFRGIAVVRPDVSAAELGRLDGLGVVGVRMNLIGAPDPQFDVEPWPEFIRQVAKLNWQIEIQAEARRWPSLLPALLKSGVNVVADHFGRPDPKLGVADPGFRYLLEAGRTRKLWVKLSGSYRNGDAESAPHLAKSAALLLRESIGVERLMWGSDWPHTQFEAATSYDGIPVALMDWLPDAADRQAVMAATPAALFRFAQSG